MRTGPVTFTFAISPYRYCTVRVAVVECESEPEVAVTVMV